MKKLLLLLLLICVPLHAEEGVEIIPGDDYKADTPVLNNELRKLDQKSKDVADRVTTIEDSPYIATSSNALTGSTVQCVYKIVTAMSNNSNTAVTTPAYDDSIPQSSEGFEWTTQAFTPTSATNVLCIRVVINMVVAVDNGINIVFLCQDSTADSLASVSDISSSGSGAGEVIVLEHWMVAGTASATTFKVRVGGPDNSVRTINGLANARKLGGVSASSISIVEYKV